MWVSARGHGCNTPLVLVARCPGCGAPASVAVHSPEHLSCGACGFSGAPSPDVTSRLREAQAALARESVGHRQLSDLQRRAVTLGPRSEQLLLGAVLLFEAPFLAMIFFSIMRGLSTSGAEARRALLGGCAYIPTVAVLAALAAVAFVQLRRMRRDLEAGCAALPPGRPGDAAGCRVCGGDVTPRGVEVVARCSYCQADNLVDPRVIREQAPVRAQQVSEYAQEVTAQARALHTAGRSKALAWVAAVPLCTCLCGCPNIFLGYRLGLVESETATCENVVVETSTGWCVGELRGGVVYVDGVAQAGAHERLSGARGIPRVRERGTGRRGRLSGSVTRARVCGSSVEVRWDDGGEPREAVATRLCWE
jgi:hypothetical protein